MAEFRSWRNKAAEIARAVREGEWPDGRGLAPAMPWRAYSALSDADAGALAAYLQSLPPIERTTPGPFGIGEQVPAPYLGIVMPRTNWHGGRGHPRRLSRPGCSR